MNVVDDGNDGDNDHENNEDDYKEYDQYVDVNVVVDDNDVDGDAALQHNLYVTRSHVKTYISESYLMVPHHTSSNLNVSQLSCCGFGYWGIQLGRRFGNYFPT